MSIRTMAEFHHTSIVNGHLVQTSEAAVPITDDGLLRGDGVFEIIRVHRGRIVCRDAHLDRLDISATTLRLPLDRGAIAEDLTALVDTLGEGDYLLQVVATRAGNRIVLARRPPPDRDAISLAVIPYCTPPLLRGAKSLSYAANMLGTRLAHERGFDDALFVDDDRGILECARSAIFWVASGVVHAPPLAAGAVDSITAREIAEVTTVVPSPTPVDSLAAASEVFIADTANDIVPVASIEGVGSFPAPGSTTLELEQALLARRATRQDP